MQNMNIDKPWIDYIAKRTFGMELEFADGDKQLIPLSSGYKWTDNKLTRTVRQLRITVSLAVR